MPLLQHITGRAYYIPGANNLGIVAAEHGAAIAVDTGIDKDTGRLLRKALDEAKLQLHAIVSTHHHADHIGGNDYLVRNVPNVRIYAPRREAPLVENPALEPGYLHYGARPFAALHTKWLMAKGAPVSHLIDDAPLDVAEVRLDVIALPGHSLAQIGVVVDDVCFAADGFFGPSVLDKHGIPYAHDVAAQLKSLEHLRACTAQWFLPGHGELVPHAELNNALDANRAAIERASIAVEAALAEPGELTTIARRVAQTLGLHFAGIPQYMIFVSVIAAHLSYLEAQGRARPVLDDATLLWGLHT